MTKSEEVDKLDANLDRLYRAFGRQQTTSAVTITGGGALTIVGVFAITIALAAVLVVSAWRSADMEKITTQAKEIARLQQKVDEHDVWIKTMYTKQKEK